MCTHIVMVLLEEDELFLEGLNLAFEVHAVQVGVINDLSQAGNVGLNTLADGQLRFIPAGTKVNGSLFLVKTRKLPMRSKQFCYSLDSEVISCQTGVINLEH